jgi:integrase
MKKYLRPLGLYPTGKGAHALRHIYEGKPHRQELDLRAVQKQLRHSSTQTTRRYPDVTDQDLQEQIKRLRN